MESDKNYVITGAGSIERDTRTGKISLNYLLFRLPLVTDVFDFNIQPDVLTIGPITRYSVRTEPALVFSGCEI